jgi:hypothetical protein
MSDEKIPAPKAQGKLTYAQRTAIKKLAAAQAARIGADEQEVYAKLIAMAQRLGYAAMRALIKDMQKDAARMEDFDRQFDFDDWRLLFYH